MDTTQPTTPLRKILISIALLAAGALVFILGSNYYSIFPTNDSQLYRGVLGIVFLAAALYLRRRGNYPRWSWVFYAFFTATMAYLVTSAVVPMRERILSDMGILAGEASHAALIKLIEALAAIATILVLSRLWGQSLGGIYIQRGRLGLALFIGGSLLVLNTATGVATGAAMGSTGEELIKRLPWAMLFSLSNAFMEEIWFRGLFLRSFGELIGTRGAILVTSITFTVMHAAATYINPGEALLYQLIIFPMALLFGYIMYKTEHIWGATLYHAGSDAFLFSMVGL